MRLFARIAPGGTCQGLMLGRSAGTPTPLRCSVQGRAVELRSTSFRSVQTAPESVVDARKRADPEPPLLAAPEIAPAGYRLALWRRGRSSNESKPAWRSVDAYHHCDLTAGFGSGEQPVPVHRTTDGIDLVYRSLGDGHHLLLLHGTSTDHTAWEPVQSVLAEHFQLSILTRRGRCGSGDSLPYVLQREFDDVATLVDALGGPVDIVGHSFGALCAIEGALKAKNVRRLVLYESPLPGAFPYWPDAVRDRMMPLLNAGQQEQALRTFLDGMVGLSQQEIEALQRLPNWPDRVSYAHTIARELQALSEYSFDVARLRSVAVPTLLLLGESSPPMHRTIADKFLSSIPDCRVIDLPGQGHLAIRFAPELVVREVLKFLQA